MLKSIYLIFAKWAKNKKKDSKLARIKSEAFREMLCVNIIIILC